MIRINNSHKPKPYFIEIYNKGRFELALSYEGSLYIHKILNHIAKTVQPEEISYLQVKDLNGEVQLKYLK